MGDTKSRASLLVTMTSVPHCLHKGLCLSDTSPKSVARRFPVLLVLDTLAKITQLEHTKRRATRAWAVNKVQKYPSKEHGRRCTSAVRRRLV